VYLFFRKLGDIKISRVKRNQKAVLLVVVALFLTNIYSESRKFFITVFAFMFFLFHVLHDFCVYLHRWRRDTVENSIVFFLIQVC